MRDRVVVRDRLQSLDIIHAEDNTCHLCEVGRENSRHLFIHCSCVYRLWSKVAGMWGLYYVGAEEVPTSFDVWCHMPVDGIKSTIWRITFLVLVCAKLEGQEYNYFSTQEV